METTLLILPNAETPDKNNSTVIDSAPCFNFRHGSISIIRPSATESKLEWRALLRYFVIYKLIKSTEKIFFSFESVEWETSNLTAKRMQQIAVNGNVGKANYIQTNPHEFNFAQLIIPQCMNVIRFVSYQLHRTLLQWIAFAF